MKDFLGNSLKEGDEVIFILQNDLKKGTVKGGGLKKVTILSSKKEIVSSFWNEEGKWESSYEEVPCDYSINFSKVFKVNGKGF